MLRRMGSALDNKAHNKFLESLVSGKNLNMDFENLRNLKDEWKQDYANEVNKRGKVTSTAISNQIKDLNKAQIQIETSQDQYFDDYTKKLMKKMEV